MYKKARLCIVTRHTLLSTRGHQMARGPFSFLSNHGHFQQGFDIDHSSSWSSSFSSTSTLSQSSTNRSSPETSPKATPDCTVPILLRMISDNNSCHPIYDLYKRRGAISGPSISPSECPHLIDNDAMPAAGLRERSPISTAEDRSWLSFSSLGSPKLDRHAIMAAHRFTSSPTSAGDLSADETIPGVEDVIEPLRPALSAHQTWLVLQNLDCNTFREHGVAIAKGTLKLGVVHSSASLKLMGCRVTLGRWHKAVWFEDECEHYKDPLAGIGICRGAGPCALELHEWVRVDERAFDKVPRTIKRAIGYYKYVKVEDKE